MSDKEEIGDDQINESVDKGNYAQISNSEPTIPALPPDEILTTLNLDGLNNIPTTPAMQINQTNQRKQGREQSDLNSQHTITKKIRRDSESSPVLSNFRQYRRGRFSGLGIIIAIMAGFILLVSLVIFFQIILSQNQSSSPNITKTNVASATQIVSTTTPRGITTSTTANINPTFQPVSDTPCVCSGVGNGMGISIGPTFHANTVTTPPNTISLPPKFFLDDLQGWDVSEADVKTAQIKAITTAPIPNSQAFELDTELLGRGNPRSVGLKERVKFSQTEPKVYLRYAKSQGINNTLDYFDLTGKTFSCSIDVPRIWATKSDLPIYIYLMAKDNDFHNLYSTAPLEISISTVAKTDQWIGLALTNIQSTAGFDAKRIKFLGVWIDTHEKSTLDYNGSMYIANCKVNYP